MGIASGVRAAGVWIALATTVLLAACGGDGGTPTHTASSGRADHRYDPLSITGTAVANAIKKLWVIATVTHRLINVSPVVKDLKRP